jgi:hypothetical protein
MRSSFILFIAIVALITGSGCSEKFDVAAPYKDITVVYAFLDNSDTAHYIRIQKAFLDQNKSALDMAREYDSSFYKNLNVTIKRFLFDGKLYDTIHLDLVNLDNEGYPKQTGTFFNTPNYAYKLSGPLNVGLIYRLVIKNLITGKVDSAESPIIDDLNFGNCYVDAFDSSLNRTGSIDFASTASYKTYNLEIGYVPAPGFTFNDPFHPGDALKNPAAAAQIIFRFNWVDSDQITRVSTPRFYDYDAGLVALNNGAYTFNIKNTALYSAMLTALGTAPTSTTARLLDRCQLFVYFATQDYRTYQQRSLIQGTGLTGNEIEPSFTNIQGTNNPLGLFTSRGIRSGRLTITNQTIDSIRLNQMFAQSNIRGTVYH